MCQTRPGLEIKSVFINMPISYIGQFSQGLAYWFDIGRPPTMSSLSNIHTHTHTHTLRQKHTTCSNSHVFVGEEKDNRKRGKRSARDDRMSGHGEEGENAKNV